MNHQVTLNAKICRSFLMYLIEYIDNVEENSKAVKRSDLSEECEFPGRLGLGKGLRVLISCVM